MVACREPVLVGPLTASITPHAHALNIGEVGTTVLLTMGVVPTRPRTLVEGGLRRFAEDLRLAANISPHHVLSPLLQASKIDLAW